MSINTNGTSNVVENSTDTNSVETYYSSLTQDLLVPVFDKFRFNLKLRLTYSFQEIMEIRHVLQSHGFKTYFHFRQSRRLTGIACAVVFTQYQSGQYAVSFVVSGNGHKLLEEAGYELGSDLDGYTNVLKNSEDYLDRNLLKIQLESITKKIDVVCSTVNEIFCSRRMFKPEWSIDIVDSEFSFHIEDAEVYSRFLLQSVLNNSRAKYGKVGLVAAKKKRTGKSFFAQSNKKFAMKCYQKLASLIRLEYTVKSENLSDSTQQTQQLINNSNLNIIKLTNETQTLFKSLMAFDYKSKEISFDSALKAIQSSCSKKAFTAIYDRLICGDGEIRVKSSEGYIYRNLKNLLEQGILLKGLSQSEYFLAPQYRKLISEHSILNKFVSTEDVDVSDDNSIQRNSEYQT